MRGPELNAHIRRALTILIDSQDELRDLDQELGDGDLGITIAGGSKAVIAALEDLDDEAAPADIIRESAKAFANANPSTMAALIAGGLLAGSRTWADIDDVSTTDAQTFVAVGAQNISQRGKAQVGDKTILDGLDAIANALVGVTNGDVAAVTAVAAAKDAVDKTKDLQSRRGRASWLQERSIGKLDPGAVALLRFVEAWQSAASDATD